jgi:ATP-dependent RNA helicase DDX42
MANAPILVAEGDEEIEVDYDSDGFPIPSESAKVIDPLPPIDHSAVSQNLYQKLYSHKYVRI